MSNGKAMIIHWTVGLIKKICKKWDNVFLNHIDILEEVLILN